MTPELRFLEFTDEWQAKRLSDVAQLTSSKRVYSSDYVSQGIPFYRGKEISELKRNKKPEDVLYISENAYQNFKSKFGAPKQNEILITAVGTLGNVLRIRDNGPFYFKDGNLIWLKDIREDPYFIEIYLEYNKNKLLQSAIGSSQKALTIVGLNKIKLSIPQKPEQQKIADFLTAVDKKIESTDKKFKLLKQYKKGVMQKIFTQQIRLKEDGGNNFPDWREVMLKDAASFMGGGTPSKTIAKFWQGETPWVSSSDIHEESTTDISYSRFITQEAIKSSATKTIPINSILVVSRVGVGKLAINDRDVCTSQDFCNIIPNLGMDVTFLAYLLKSKIPELLSFNQGTSIKGFTKEDLTDLTVNIPHQDEQKKIADFLSSIDAKIKAEETKLASAKKFKKALLQRLFV